MSETKIQVTLMLMKGSVSITIFRCDCGFRDGACLTDFIETIDWVDRFFKGSGCITTAIHSDALSMGAM